MTSLVGKLISIVLVTTFIIDPGTSSRIRDLRTSPVSTFEEKHVAAQFPFLAKISYKPLLPRAKYARCTAVVYNALWLLTSVRCAIPTIRRQNGRPSHDWGDVDFGGADHKTSLCMSGDPSNYRFITEVAVPPTVNYSAHGSLTKSNIDIALLRLNKPLTFSRTLRPIAIARSQEDCVRPEGGLFLGWGVKRSRARQTLMTDELHAMRVQVLPVAVCTLAVRGFNGDMTLCAAAMNIGKRTCFSDTGGPLIYSATKQGTSGTSVIRENLLCGILPVSSCSRNDSLTSNWIEYFTKVYRWTYWIRGIAGEGL